MAAAGSPAEELGHDGLGRDALAEGMDVIAVGAADGVALVQELDEACGDGFLAVVEVDEAVHLPFVI